MKLFALVATPWINLLGLTLLHSLWQGTLIALALAAALRLSRNQTARQRYGWCVAAILFWITASGFTFFALTGAAGRDGSAALM
ncbi:MAG TPA: hypothetical protein PLG50_04465 [bacterium]|nr:hypothetical protein [bacterium]HQG44890.1 hypothetical protein [bacterium]HQI50068.1 hypothetical protein [bacterium]HQJ63708.1 hypothetical protein [bacterium]